MHFSEWVLKEDPSEGLRIFNGKPYGALPNSGQLNLPCIQRIKVLDHLEQINASVSTRIAYVEMLIFEANETSSIFHDGLIKLYLKEIYNAVEIQQLEAEQSRAKYGLAAGDTVETLSDVPLGKHGYVGAGTKALVSSVVPDTNLVIQVQVTFPQTGTITVIPQALLRKIGNCNNITCLQTFCMFVLFRYQNSHSC